MSTTLRLVSEMERIANSLGAERGEASQVSLSSVAEKIAKNLGVKNDGVAILAVSKRWRHLRESVEALRSLWSRDDVGYEGEIVKFPPVRLYPRPVQKPGPPILLPDRRCSSRNARPAIRQRLART